MRVKNKEILLLVIILVISISVRLWGIDYDLPYIYHPDEPLHVTISQNIIKTGDLNPHFFRYPSLFLYINSFGYILFFLLGKISGVLSVPADILSPTSLAMGVTFAPMPKAILMGRLITTFFGVGTVGLTYWAGRQISDKSAVGLLASLFLALSPSNVVNSRFITPDTFVTFFAVFSFLGSLFVYQRGKFQHYLLAGLLAGFTASSKYNGVLIILSLIFAHFLRYGIAGFKQQNLYFGLLFCGIGFLMTTPYALLDFPKFLFGLKSESIHYSSGHAGMEGNALAWYLKNMWQTSALIYIFAGLEILRGIFSRSKETILLSSFSVTYFIFISNFVVRNERTFLVLTPFLFLLAALFIDYLIQKYFSQKIIQKWAYVFFAIVAIIQPLYGTLENARHLNKVNSREVARVWINENLPEGAKIAIESYSPYIDPSRFVVHGFSRMIDHEPKWYIEQGFDYLVFSDGMYARFFQEPEKYPLEISKYENLFNSFEVVKIFNDYGEIRVYKVR